MRSYTTLLIGLLFLMAVLALVCVFNITVNERLREFGILMSMGARKSQIRNMLLLEAGLIGLLGGLAGLILAGGGVILFSDVITSAMGIPYLATDVVTLSKIAGICIAGSVLTSILSTLYAAMHVSAMEPFQMIQEVDA